MQTHTAVFVCAQFDFIAQGHVHETLFAMHILKSNQNLEIFTINRPKWSLKMPQLMIHRSHQTRTVHHNGKLSSDNNRKAKPKTTYNLNYHVTSWALCLDFLSSVINGLSCIVFSCVLLRTLELYYIVWTTRKVIKVIMIWEKFFAVDWQKFNLLQQVICRKSERP